MHRTPSFHALRAFEAAARLGSFTKAGEALNLTPSAISHQVKAVEEQLRRSMFIRAHRQVILTPEGERLLAALTEAFGIIQTACAELGPGAPDRDLSVHCTPSLASKWLSPRLPGFMAAEPAIKIRLSSSAEAPDLMKSSTIDVAIAYGKEPRASGLTVVPLGEEDVVALCAPGYRAEGADWESAPGSVTWLVSSLSPVTWRDWFDANGLVGGKVATGSEFDRGSLAIAAAVQGVGVALETTRFAETEIVSGSLVRFGGENSQGIKRALHFLFYRTRDHDVPRVRTFRNWILKQAIAS